MSKFSIMIFKIGRFFELFAFLLGLVGGIGYTLYFGAYFVSVGILVLGCMAIPEVIVAVQDLLEK